MNGNFSALNRKRWGWAWISVLICDQANRVEAADFEEKKMARHTSMSRLRFAHEDQTKFFFIRVDHHVGNSRTWEGEFLFWIGFQILRHLASASQDVCSFHWFGFPAMEVVLAYQSYKERVLLLVCRCYHGFTQQGSSSDVLGSPETKICEKANEL